MKWALLLALLLLTLWMYQSCSRPKEQYCACGAA